MIMKRIIILFLTFMLLLVSCIPVIAYDTVNWANNLAPADIRANAPSFDGDSLIMYDTISQKYYRFIGNYGYSGAYNFTGNKVEYDNSGNTHWFGVFIYENESWSELSWQQYSYEFEDDVNLLYVTNSWCTFMIEGNTILFLDDGSIRVNGKHWEYTGPTITGIRIAEKPIKTKYIVNEDTELDLTGLVVMATYSDGTEYDVTSKITVSDVDFTFVHGVKVHVTYESFEDTFVITVGDGLSENESMSNLTFFESIKKLFSDMFDNLTKFFKELFGVLIDFVTFLFDMVIELAKIVLELPKLLSTLFGGEADGEQVEGLFPTMINVLGAFFSDNKNAKNITALAFVSVCIGLFNLFSRILGGSKFGGA